MKKDGPGETTRSLNVDQVVEQLWRDMPAIAKHLIATNLDQSDPNNASYLNEPDNPKEHNPSWHQWGVITHSRMVGRACEQDAPAYLARWGLEDRVNQVMTATIDGISKSDLLRVAIVLHDLGKFSRRQLIREDGAIIRHSFRGHEQASGAIVRSPEFAANLETMGLTSGQVEYLAHCSELHYRLGELRGKAKKSAGYNISFVNSPDFEESSRQLRDSYPDVQLEIGLFFMVDSLGKTEVRLSADTDNQIQEQASLVSDRLQSIGLTPELLPAVLQGPVNLAAARKYLELWSLG